MGKEERRQDGTHDSGLNSIQKPKEGCSNQYWEGQVWHLSFDPQKPHLLWLKLMSRLDNVSYPKHKAAAELESVFSDSLVHPRLHDALSSQQL